MWGMAAVSDEDRLDRVQTSRTVCERLRPEDSDELAVLLRHPRVARTAWAKPEPPTEAEVASQVIGHVEHWRRHGFGLWLLRDRATGAMLGRGGLQHTDVDGRDQVEIAWAIVPERWGEGLATELALKSVAIAFDDLGVDELVVLTLPDNIASRRVAEKAGFRYERDIEHADLPHVLYRSSRATRSGDAEAGR